jgi:hypothetical protein
MPGDAGVPRPKRAVMSLQIIVCCQFAMRPKIVIDECYSIHSVSFSSIRENCVVAIILS